MKKHRLDIKALKSGKPKGPAIEPPLPNPRKRPEHKKALRLARLNEEHQRKIVPEPLFTFGARLQKDRLGLTQVDIDALEVRSLKREATLGRIEKAAQADAEWNNSDPFAYGRTALYVKQGWINPVKHVDEFHKRVLARKAARAKEVEDAKNVTTPSV